MNAPFFIVGTERSGSNLLRLILSVHPEIYLPHPPHLMRCLRRHEHRYGELTRTKNLARLIDDVLTLVRLHPYPFEFRPTREQVQEVLPSQSLLGVVLAVYEAASRLAGKPRWGCKSTFMLDHLGGVFALCPTAKFVHLVRDGREVAASAKASIFNDFHVWYSASRWRDEQRLAYIWSQELPPERFHTLRYEDLLAAPEERLRALCAFLELPFHSAMLEHSSGPEARRCATLSSSWQNTDRPIGQYGATRRPELSPEELSLFEALAHRELVAWGYPLRDELVPVLTRGARPTWRPTYWFSQQFLRLRVELRHLRDPITPLRLRKRLWLAFLPWRATLLRLLG